MNILIQIFYALSVFFILYSLYEMLNYPRTKSMLGAIKQSITDDIPLPTEYGSKYLIDGIAFVWVILSMIYSIFNGIMPLMFVSIGILLTGIIQMAVIINLSKRYKDKGVTLSYYISTFMFFILFSTIFIMAKPLDLL